MLQKLLISLAFKYILKLAKRAALRTSTDIDDEIVKDLERIAKMDFCSKDVEL